MSWSTGETGGDGSNAGFAEGEEGQYCDRQRLAHGFGSTYVATLPMTMTVSQEYGHVQVEAVVVPLVSSWESWTGGPGALG